MKIEEQIGLKSGGTVQIDKEAGVIRGVKILGLVSSNGRRYKPEALRGAIGMYEGLGVNLDHIDDDERRRVLDGFGRTRNVHMRDDGLYGDLEYLRKHPYSEQFIEAAERMPEQIGLSHSAFGKIMRDKDEEVVEEIHKVKSVDLVRYPASTRGLFEDQRGVNEYAEGSEGTSMSSARQHFRAAVMSIIDDGSLSIEEIGRKIMTTLKAEEKVLGKPEGQQTVTPSPESKENETPKEGEKKVEEAKIEEAPKPDDNLTKMETKIEEMRHDMAVMECCQSHRIDVSAMSNEQLSELRSKKDRESMDKFAESLPPAVKHGEKPAMPGGSKSEFDALHEEMASMYGFAK